MRFAYPSTTSNVAGVGRSRFTQFNADRIVYEDARANFVTSEVGLSYSASLILLAASLGG